MMNKKKISGLAAIIAGCILSAKTNIAFEEVMAHGLTTIGAYTLGKENMKDVYKNTCLYSRSGLKKLGIYTDD